MTADTKHARVQEGFNARSCCNVLLDGVDFGLNQLCLTRCASVCVADRCEPVFLMHAEGSRRVHVRLSSSSGLQTLSSGCGSGEARIADEGQLQTPDRVAQNLVDLGEGKDVAFQVR